MKLICTVFLTVFCFNLVGQSKEFKIYTSDIQNFWEAYDSINTTKSYTTQLKLINKLYINKGTKGLKLFMKGKNYTDSLYVDLIKKFPKFWNSVRKNTLRVEEKKEEIQKGVLKLQKIYPDLKPAKMYFTIGGLRSGGTVKKGNVLVGAEISTGDSLVDVSEFSNNWLKNVFASQSIDRLVEINVHEYVHTQQKGNPKFLLAKSLSEGVCDFITELSLNKQLNYNYLVNGRKNENYLKEKFKKELFFTNYSEWLYNGGKMPDNADLGYFMGYAISKSYYLNSLDKEKAVKEIIELNYNNEKEVVDFLNQSKYYEEIIDKDKFFELYNKNKPVVEKLSIPNKSKVSSEVTELAITFSKPMQKKLSINKSKDVDEMFPITQFLKQSKDRRTFYFEMKLKPKAKYGFILTSKRFTSEDGFKFQGNYEVTFETE